MTIRHCQISEFITHDDEVLTYRHWEARSEKPRGAIILFHRGHEHSSRMAHLVDELDLPELAFFAWDARGHGQSPGPRGYSPSIGAAVRDVESFVRHIGEQHGISQDDTIVVGQSVGAVLAAGWVHDYAPKIRGMVLAAPAFDVRLYVPFARPALRLARALRGDFFVNSYVKPRLLTHDPDRVRSYKSDPLIARAISVNMLLGLHDLSNRLIEDAAAITVPTQLLISGSDWVVGQPAQHRFFERLGSAIKERHVLKGFFHDTLGERDRAPATAKLRDFIVARFEQGCERPCLRNAHRHGFTRRETDRLTTPLPPMSARGLYWRFAKAVVRAGGLLSHGMRLGFRTGFDSGSMLDYVYENTPRGFSPVGRAVDRTFLNAVGWAGIRRRKSNIEELLARAFQLTGQSGRPIRVLDVAAGHGRMVLDAVQNTGAQPETIRLQDFCADNVAAGRDLIGQRRCADIATFSVGDAFDPVDLASNGAAPNVVLVSGLYELFSDNDLVADSLAAISSQIEPGGYLIYTGQPWHPQIELIARTLTSHRGGRPWIMRRRTQAELDQLVAAAGFDKLEQRIDEAGIFTVSLAQKRPLSHQRDVRVAA